MNHIKFLAFAAASASALCASAHSVALSENFNGDYSANFPTMLELDHLAPFDNFRPLFTDENGVARPWWKLKDSSASDDGFISSHSAYTTLGTSNDWLISRAIEIPTTGYTLSFGAQSFVMRVEGDRVSDLWVYVTEFEPTEDNLPTEPTMHIERVPEGKYTTDIEKDFTYYSIPLDEYAGKSIYVSFANLNTDKDILCVDDVLVQRLDIAELSATSPRYVEAGDYEVTSTFAPAAEASLKNYKLTFNPGDGSGDRVIESGDVLEPGTTLSPVITQHIDADETHNWTLTLTADDMNPVITSGTVSGLSFIPWHRVLLEEATGIWCGNCPLGIYAIEKMITHPEMKDYVIPVSLHMTQGAATSDLLTCDNYIYMSGLNYAPSMRVDRSLVTTMFSIEHDGAKEVDPSNSKSVAGLVSDRHNTTVLLDVDVTGDFVIEGNDTTAVKAKVTIRPAMTLNSKNYRVGFILTENNVGLDIRYYNQHNYFSGYNLDSRLGGFCDMPEEIPSWRYMDVARTVYDFKGTDDVVMPEVMEMDRDYTYEVTIPIPDTYQETTTSSGKTICIAPSVVAENLSLIAFVLDDNFSAINSDIYPMTEQSEVRPTILDQMVRLGYTSGVDEIITSDADAPAVYYNLSGMRVDNPGPGIYVVRRGNTVTKEVIR